MKDLIRTSMMLAINQCWADPNHYSILVWLQLMLEVSAGIIISKQKVLCFQKGNSKYSYLSLKYEFPGGKVEPGEDPKETVIRELHEELGIDCTECTIQHFCDTTHNYPDFSVTIHSFLIYMSDVKYVLTEHQNVVFSLVKDLNQLDWVDADKKIVRKLEEYYGR